jgi:hypothetical protein
VAGYGSVIVSGSSKQEIALAEYNSTGTLVSTFGNSGVTLLPVGYSATGNAVMVSSGLIYVAGVGNGTNTAVLAQFNSSGTLSRLVARTSGSEPKTGQVEWH